MSAGPETPSPPASSKRIRDTAGLESKFEAAGQPLLQTQSEPRSALEAYFKEELDVLKSLPVKKRRLSDADDGRGVAPLAISNPVLIPPGTVRIHRSASEPPQVSTLAFRPIPRPMPGRGESAFHSLASHSSHPGEQDVSRSRLPDFPSVAAGAASALSSGLSAMSANFISALSVSGPSNGARASPVILQRPSSSTQIGAAAFPSTGRVGSSPSVPVTSLAETDIGDALGTAASPSLRSISFSSTTSSMASSFGPSIMSKQAGPHGIDSSPPFYSKTGALDAALPFVKPSVGMATVPPHPGSGKASRVRSQSSAPKLSASGMPDSFKLSAPSPASSHGAGRSASNNAQPWNDTDGSPGDGAGGDDESGMTHRELAMMFGLSSSVDDNHFRLRDFRRSLLSKLSQEHRDFIDSREIDRRLLCDSVGRRKMSPFEFAEKLLCVQFHYQLHNGRLPSFSNKLEREAFERHIGPGMSSYLPEVGRRAFGYIKQGSSFVDAVARAVSETATSTATNSSPSGASAPRMASVNSLGTLADAVDDVSLTVPAGSTSPSRDLHPASAVMGAPAPPRTPLQVSPSGRVVA